MQSSKNEYRYRFIVKLLKFEIIFKNFWCFLSVIATLLAKNNKFKLKMKFMLSLVIPRFSFSRYFKLIWIYWILTQEWEHVFVSSERYIIHSQTTSVDIFQRSEASEKHRVQETVDIYIRISKYLTVAVGNIEVG